MDRQDEGPNVSHLVPRMNSLRDTSKEARGKKKKEEKEKPAGLDRRVVGAHLRETRAIDDDPRRRAARKLLHFPTWKRRIIVREGGDTRRRFNWEGERNRDDLQVDRRRSARRGRLQARAGGEKGGGGRRARIKEGRKKK